MIPQSSPSRTGLDRAIVPLAALATVAIVVLIVGIAVVLRRGSDTGGSETLPPLISATTGSSVSTPDSNITTSSGPIDVDAVSTLPSAAAVTTTSTTAVSVTTNASTTSMVGATTAGPVGLTGDLGLSVPISQPQCDGRYIVIVASAVIPAFYATTVQGALDANDGTGYLRTASTCPSLRPELDGNDIYVVFSGPHETREDACSALTSVPDGSYVKALSNDLPFSHTVSC